MRAQKTSSIQSRVSSNTCWWTPSVNSRLSVTTWTLVVPKKLAISVVAAPVKQPCAAGYSGWLGVVPRETQVGSAGVSPFPPPARIAVTGLQKPYLYFALKHPIAASAAPVQSIAIRRAASVVPRLLLLTRVLNTRAYCCPVCSVQKTPISVSAADRTVLFVPP